MLEPLGLTLLEERVHLGLLDEPSTDLASLALKTGLSPDDADKCPADLTARALVVPQPDQAAGYEVVEPAAALSRTNLKRSPGSRYSESRRGS